MKCIAARRFLNSIFKNHEATRAFLLIKHARNFSFTSKDSDFEDVSVPPSIQALAYVLFVGHHPT